MAKDNSHYVKKLPKNLAQKFFRARSYSDLVDSLLEETDLPAGLENRDDSIIEYGKKLHLDGEDHEKQLRLFSYLLRRNRNSPEAHHFLGKIFEGEQLYYQGHLLFDKGLRLWVPDSDDEFHLPNYHRIFHYDLCDMSVWIRIENQELSLRDCGYPFDILHTKYTNPRKRERELIFIHKDLANVDKINGLAHKADNCPYFGLIDDN